MHRTGRSDPGLLTLVVADGRPLLSLTALALLFSGAMAVFLAARREFLPHDIAYLGLDAAALCRFADCQIVAFMFHDRVAFGGTLVAIGLFYLWLVAGPLGDGERWAWRALLWSGVAGFLSFLAYLGYGYLDTWHGIATLALLPFFAIGLARTRHVAVRPASRSPAWRADAPALLRAARWMLLGTAAGVMAAGMTILVVGMTAVFVPQDLDFMGLTREGLNVISPRLIPLIAHDRAGFGGGLVATGMLIGFCAWYAPATRAYRQTMLAAGTAGFGAGIGVHYAEGYTVLSHLMPALAGALLFLTGAAMEFIGARREVAMDPSSPDGPVAR
jgi:hypothetical protein